MRRRYFVSAAIGLLAIMVGPLAGAEEKTPAAAPAVVDEKPLLMVAQDIAYARIVLADRPDLLGLNYSTWRLDRTRSVRYAAEFLQKYIERATGVTVPIVSESSISRGRPMILVGRSTLTDFVENDRKQLPPEGFIVRRRENRVAIVGEVAPEDDLKEYRGADRGTLFGVYEFLEQVLGVRWYFPDELGVVIPPCKIVQVRQLDITKSPCFPMRTGAVYSHPANGEFGDAMPVARFGNTTGFHANHTCYHWYKYAKDHPELFAVGPDGERMIDPSGPGGNKFNHLCYSEPKTLEMDLEELRIFDETGFPPGDLSLAPTEKYVRCVPKDIENIYHCHCPRCRAKWTPDRENSGLSDVIFGYMARYAEEIAQRQPGRRLATLSYCGFLYPPTTVTIPDNLDVMICTVKGNMKLVAPGHWRHSTDVIERWLETVHGDPRRLFLFEYLVYPSLDAPALYPYTMQRWFRFLRGKVSGGFNNADNPRSGPVRYRFSLINGWFWHKLLWNPDADVDALLAGWYRDLFGPAAKPMGELFGLTIDCWEKARWGDDLNPGSVSHVHDRFLFRHVYPVEAVERMKALLSEGRRAAQADGLCARRVEYFGEAFDGFFTNAASFHAADAPPPRQEIKGVKAPPEIDGKLEDPAWRDAAVMPLRDRRRGEAPPVESIVRLLHDGGGTLYLSGRFEAPDRGALVVRGAARDDEAILSDDRLELDLDLRHNDPLALSSFYRIAVNAAGQIADGVKMVPIVSGNLHRSEWNPFWNAEGIRVATGHGEGFWSAELALPLGAIPEYARRPRPEIRVQVSRISRAAPAGIYAWSPALHESYEVDLERFGVIVLGP